MASEILQTAVGHKRPVHVLTAFHRRQNALALRKNLKPKDVLWHPICDVPFDLDEPWMFPLDATPPFWWDACYWKLNYWLETQEIVDDDWYCFLNDDDLYEKNVIDRVREIENSRVVIVSMHRGHQVPRLGMRHQATTLIANSGNMMVGRVGLEQIFVRGNVARNIRFENYSGADGLMIAQLVRQHPVVYLPDVYVHFNRLQPGRYMNVCSRCGGAGKLFFGGRGQGSQIGPCPSCQKP